MRLRLVLWAIWALVSAGLAKVLQETFWSAFTDWIIRKLGFSEGAQMIASLASIAAPLAMSGILIGLAYAIAFKEGKKSNLPPSAPIPPPLPKVAEWLAPKAAFQRFTNQQLENERRVAEITINTTQRELERLNTAIDIAFQNADPEARDNPKIDELTEAIEELTPKYEIAYDMAARLKREIQSDLYGRLSSGKLVAKGLLAPIKENSVEIAILPAWWRFLTVDTDAGTATGDNVKVVGLRIGEPVK